MVPYETRNWLRLLLSVRGTVLPQIAIFGIDEIGVEIEDPFGYDANDLPLASIGETLSMDVAQATA